MDVEEFGGGDAETLRHYIAENYKVNEIASLPSRVFYPYMAIKTYLLTISQGETDAVNVVKYSFIKKGNQEILDGEERLLFSD